MTKGIPVFDLIPGCHAERAGVQKGDQILVVNGQEVNNFDDYISAAALEKHFRTMVIQRGDTLIDIEMVIGQPLTEGTSN